MMELTFDQMEAAGGEFSTTYCVGKMLAGACIGSIAGAICTGASIENI